MPPPRAYNVPSLGSGRNVGPSATFTGTFTTGSMEGKKHEMGVRFTFGSVVTKKVHL